MADDIDTGPIVAELAPRWTAGLDGAELAEGRRLLEELVSDWAREAGPTPDPQAVLRFQRRDLDAVRTGPNPADRLETLRGLVTARRVDHLGARTLDLGKAILAGSITDDDARVHGAALLAAVEAAAADVRKLPPGIEADAVRRELGDALMEALFAVERSAMSARLARSSAAAGDGPSLRP